MQVKLSALLFKDLIAEIAFQFKVKPQQDCLEYYLDLPSHIGKGTISGVNFKDGLGILFFDCVFKEQVEFVYQDDSVLPVKFIFCIKGEFDHFYSEASQKEKIEQYQNFILACRSGQSHRSAFRAGVHTKTSALHINRRIFSEEMGCQIKKLPEELKTLFLDITSKSYFFHLGNYGMGTANSLFKIDDHPKSSFERDLLIRKECYSIFYRQLKEYKAMETAKVRNLEIENREIKQIYEASKIIEDTLSCFKTVRELAYHVGLNPNKLQAGFKSVYGQTVNDYIQEKRIEKALVLIRNTSLTFSEIADEVGIKSKSYFSKIFKDRYGYTPTQIRKRLQQKEKTANSSSS